MQMWYQVIQDWLLILWLALCWWMLIGATAQLQEIAFGLRQIANCLILLRLRNSMSEETAEPARQQENQTHS